jgi:benzoylformate decarboxylase
VKWSIEPARASDVPLAFARAYYTAMLPPRGPVFLSIPADDWDQPSELVPEKIVATAMRPDAQTMDWIESQLDKSMKPAFVVGAGVDRDGAWSEVLRLAEAHNARVWAAPRSGRCSFPENHPLFAGFLPPIREKIVALLDGHDLIFAIGAPAFTYHVEGCGPHFPKDAQVCQLIDDPATAAWTPTGTVAVGSIRLGVLDLLARPITMQRQPPALREPAPVVQPSRPMTTAFALQVLHKMRDPNSIIVEEAPSARSILQRYLPITRATGFFTTDSGGLGYGLPAALGVALAKPHEKIIAIIGDGSAMYSIQALWTAARLQLPITFVILNNRRYAALQEFAPQFGYARGEQIKGSDLPGIDFVAIAHGHGCSALRVDEPGDLESAIRDALRSPSPMLLELEVV